MKRKYDTLRRPAWLGAVSLVLGLAAAWAEDWPTYMHDAQRSGITAETLGTNLVAAWTFPRVQKPAPAWSDEAKRDYWATPNYPTPLKNRLDFDRVNQVAVVDGHVLIGSSSEDTVTCLDAVTGEPKWRFFADGPVRMAPTVTGGRVYVGSDDGSAYCLDATSGTLVWKHTPSGANNYLVANNGRFVSPWAIRSGVVVDGGTAYCAAGIFPGEGVFVTALNALTGERQWQLARTNLGSLQGYALLSATRLYVPGARSTPHLFARSNGAYQGQYNGNNAFGTFALLSGGNLFMGPAKGPAASITMANDSGGDVLASYANGNAVVVTATNTFLLSDTALTALVRKGGSTLWTKAVSYPYALILAGTTLYAGGDQQVAAFDMAKGTLLWKAPVRGRAFGLAVSHGYLLVSTDQGLLHAFTQPSAGGQSSVVVY